MNELNKMNTTISVSQKIKDQLKEFGDKGETYNDIIRRLLKSAGEHQLQMLLLDRRGTITIEEAREKAMKRWHKK